MHVRVGPPGPPDPGCKCVRTAPAESNARVAGTLLRLVRQPRAGPLIGRGPGPRPLGATVGSPEPLASRSRTVREGGGPASAAYVTVAARGRFQAADGLAPVRLMCLPSPGARHAAVRGVCGDTDVVAESCGPQPASCIPLGNREQGPEVTRQLFKSNNSNHIQIIVKKNVRYLYY